MAMWSWIISCITTFVIPLWIVTELGFCFLFYRVWLPRFQKLKIMPEYRDYVRDRQRLLMRILKRIEMNCRQDKTAVIPTIRKYVREWFHPVSTTANTTATTSQHNNEEFWPKKGDMNSFFAWAFYSRELDEMEPWMNKDMERMYETIGSQYSIYFEDGNTPEYQPMRLSLDPIDSNYRPFIIYGFFVLIKIMAGLLLRAFGFYACKTTNGLNYFYRPPKRMSSSPPSSCKGESGINIDSRLPLIFLHGIAPGGLAFYLPMLLYLGGDGRPLFFFENPGISFLFYTHTPPNEQTTVFGIWEAVDHHLSSVQDVSVVGHSFGSCAVTWLIHSGPCARIRQIVLVEPVSICLSEPDVIQNFLYQRKALQKRAQNKIPIKIGVVSNEIFTEHYLRRHFAWYNSELWIEDLPEHAKVLVCLSEEDRIVPTQKVQQELMRKPEVEILIWEDAGHGHCVTKPRTWRQMQIVMKRQEQLIAQESTFTKIL